MATYVTETQLASYLRVTIPAGQATTILDLTNNLITDYVGTITPAPAEVTAIAFEVAARAWRNPQGLSSVTRSIDDYDKTERREGDMAMPPGVYLTAEEEARLRSYITDRPARVGTISLGVRFE